LISSLYLNTLDDNDGFLPNYFSKKYSSLYEARNLGINVSKGSYIAFLDTDDFWTKDKLRIQMAKFKDKNVSLVYSNYFLYNQVTKKKKIYTEKILPQGYASIDLLKNYLIGISTVILRKSLFDKYKFNLRFNIIGDFDLFLRLSKKFKFAAVQDPLVYYRVHNKSYSKNNYFEEIKELNYWVKNQKLFTKKELNSILKKISYMTIMNNIIEKKKIIALKMINKLPINLIKIKLSIILILPNIFVRFLKKNF
jgi:glycosyltransferase involved in cell wall biosynthesis